jgi:predicted O-methyltransferase YrrM
MKSIELKIIDPKETKIPDWKDKDFKTKIEPFLVSPLLKSIILTYKTQAVGVPSESIQAGVKVPEGYHLYSLVKDNKFENILEIGFAYGISALFICEALKENGSGKLISVDPYQSTQWKNIAVKHLEQAGLSKYSKLMEEPSYSAMPKILSGIKGFGSNSKDRVSGASSMDLIFIDGMHLFDYTLVDLFYADLLLKVGGVVVLDDIRHKGVKQSYEYILKNYSHWKLVKPTLASETCATFIKVKNDDRSWDYHRFF